MQAVHCGNHKGKFAIAFLPMNDEKEIKAANDRCLYQEVYNRRDDLRLLGIPESTDTENASNTSR